MLLINILLVIIVFLLMTITSLIYYIYKTNLNSEYELKKILILFNAYDSYTKFKYGDLTHSEMVKNVEEFEEG